MKSKTILWILMIVFLLNVFAVTAADNLPSTLDEVAKTLDFGKWVDSPDKQLFFDAILYFIFFIGIAQVALAKKFEGRGGKAAIVAIGIVLAAAMVFYESGSTFRLVSLWPVAMLMLVVFIIILMYRFIKGEEKAGAAVWWAIILTYITVMAIFPDAVEWLRQTMWGRTIIAIFTVLMIIAIPMAIVALFKGAKTEEEPAADWKGMMPGKESEERAAREAVKSDEDEAEGHREKARSVSKKEADYIKKLEEINAEEIATDEELLRALKQVKNYLDHFAKYKTSRFKTEEDLLNQKARLIAALQKIRTVGTADIEREIDDSKAMEIESALEKLVKVFKGEMRLADTYEKEALETVLKKHLSISNRTIQAIKTRIDRTGQIVGLTTLAGKLQKEAQKMTNMRHQVLVNTIDREIYNTMLDLDKVNRVAWNRIFMSASNHLKKAIEAVQTLMNYDTKFRDITTKMLDYVELERRLLRRQQTGTSQNPVHQI